MQRLHLALWLGLPGLLLADPTSAQDKGEVKLEIVNYDGLKNAVLKNRGKVLVVEFWGEF
jgi:hypothetical protein